MRALFEQLYETCFDRARSEGARPRPVQVVTPNPPLSQSAREHDVQTVPHFD
jgi:hypothetical protein